MIIHCSAKLVDKLPVKPPKQSEMPAIGKLQHWHAHFLTFHRRQCVLFCEDETRFMLLAKGLNKGMMLCLKELFDQFFAEALEECCGIDYADTVKILDYCGDWQFDSTTDRSVQSSMRAALHDLKCYFANHDLMDTPHGEIHKWLNYRPLRIKGKKDCLWPDSEMTAVAKRIASREVFHE